MAKGAKGFDPASGGQRDAEGVRMKPMAGAKGTPRHNEYESLSKEFEKNPDAFSKSPKMKRLQKLNAIYQEAD